MNFTMIRVMKITFLQRPATAIYFSKMTGQVQQMRLQTDFLKEKTTNESLQSYSSTVSHEFRTPIGTSLMFLEQLLDSGDLGDDAKSTIRLVI